MQRLRLKADGRIVELRDGQEFPLQPAGGTGSVGVRDLRRRAYLAVKRSDVAAFADADPAYECFEHFTKI